MENPKIIYLTIFIILISIGIFFLSYSMSPFNEQENIGLAENTSNNDVSIYRNSIANQNCELLKDKAFRESCIIEVIINKALTEDNETICNEMPEEIYKTPCIDKIYFNRAISNSQADFCKYIELEKTRQECNEAVSA